MEVGALGIIGAIVRFGIGTGAPQLQPPPQPRFLRCSIRPVPVPDPVQDDSAASTSTVPNPNPTQSLSLDGGHGDGEGIRIRRRSPVAVHYVGPFQFRMETPDNTPRNILEKIIWDKDAQLSLVRVPLHTHWLCFLIFNSN